MFKKVLKWNYMTLMPSASPYTRCLIAPGWWDSLSPGHFLHCEMNRLVMITHFFSSWLFLHLPCPKAGWEVRQWHILCILAFKSAWSFSKEAVFVSLRVKLFCIIFWSFRSFLFYCVGLLLKGQKATKSFQIHCFPSFMVRAGLSPS